MAKPAAVQPESCIYSGSKRRDADRRASQFRVNCPAMSRLSMKTTFSALRVSADLVKLKLPVITTWPSTMVTLLWAIAGASSIQTGMPASAKYVAPV